jgi:hypothetical protein
MIWFNVCHPFVFLKVLETVNAPLEPYARNAGEVSAQQRHSVNVQLLLAPRDVRIRVAVSADIPGDSGHVETAAPCGGDVYSEACEA